LSSRRIHAGQFTQRRPETALSEQMALLRPRTTDLRLAPRVRIAVGDYLLGQHRECIRAHLRRRDTVAALRVALGALRFPDRIMDAAHFSLLSRGTPRAVLGAIMPVVSVAVRVGHRAVRALERLRGHPARQPRVFIDGTPLGDERTGYFTFVSEIVRSLIVDGPGAPDVEVAATSSGRAALKETIGPRISRLRWRWIRREPRHWAAPYESLARPAVQALAAASWAGLMAAGLLLRLLPLVLAGSGAAALQGLFLADRELSRRLRRLGRGYRPPLVQKAFLRLHNARWAPRRPGGAGLTEIVTWRGRFRFRRSRRIAFVPDLTTRIGPEWHTEANIREFDEFLAYALRYADALATVSENSRHDIIARLGVPASRVLIAPSFIHPVFFSSVRPLGDLAGYNLQPGYILSVCTAEPRKNLRRLVRAFESLAEDGRGGPVLALAGPAGWDEGFERFLTSSAARARIRRLGFVPLEHLPTLYAQAGLFIYPSLYEGFGLPVLEAMASGALVAASRTSSLPEVLGDAGIFFDPGSDRAVAGALERALRLAPAEAVELRTRARQRAEEMVAVWKSNGPWPLADDAVAEDEKSGRRPCG
jgi:alpha-1,3-rhamnosyl/mannosyltransferase